MNKIILLITLIMTFVSFTACLKEKEQSEKIENVRIAEEKADDPAKGNSKTQQDAQPNLSGFYIFKSWQEYNESWEELNLFIQIYYQDGKNLVLMDYYPDNNEKIDFNAIPDEISPVAPGVYRHIFQDEYGNRLTVDLETPEKNAPITGQLWYPEEDPYTIKLVPIFPSDLYDSEEDETAPDYDRVENQDTDPQIQNFLESESIRGASDPGLELFFGTIEGIQKEENNGILLSIALENQNISVIIPEDDINKYNIEFLENNDPDLNLLDKIVVLQAVLIRENQSENRPVYQLSAMELFDGGKFIPAGIANALNFYELLSDLQKALRTEQWDAIADYLEYPCTLGHSLDEKIYLEKKEDFIVARPFIFTMNIRESLLNQTIDILQITDKGVVFSNGCMTINSNMKISAINP